jgi:hypothetical protein
VRVFACQNFEASNMPGLLARLKAVFKHPTAPAAPFHYIPGPLYSNDPALQAIYVHDYAKPWRDMTGGGGVVRGQLATLPGPLSYALKAIPIVGIGQQVGQYALQETTDFGGQYIDADSVSDAAQIGVILQ